MDIRLTPTVLPVENHNQRTEDPKNPVVRAARRRGSTLQSTPVLFAVLAGVLAVLLVASCVVTVQLVGARQDTHGRLLATTEPLANASQNLYSALSVADAAAVTGFISGGIEPAEVRERYLDALAEASDHLVIAAAGLTADQAHSTRNLTEIGRMLPVYTGLIETARANSRVGNPVASAYLGEASYMMQSVLLPAAQELQSEGISAVEATQRAAVRPPWPAIGLLLVTVAALVAVHMLVSRKTRRTVNLGLLVAIAAAGSLLAWLLVAGLVSSDATERALEQGAEPLAVLTESRILAQQSRTAETLLLAQRHSTGAYDGTYGERITRLGELLERYGGADPTEAGAEAVQRAQAARDAWINSHARTTDALERGDYEAAVVLVIGPGPDESTAQFTTLDGALSTAIAESRTELRDNESRASRTLSGLVPAAVILVVIALTGSGIGLWRRIREYQ
ncbi:hypothetical protein [Rhodococcus sp. (in: high G+C Gram-positive bacteria)]|uniref:hypothetical protein n=1 Tax=Rhodococcus sp. TaxID=1831 RepID=UPI003F0773AD